MGRGRLPYLSRKRCRNDAKPYGEKRRTTKVEKSMCHSYRVLPTYRWVWEWSELKSERLKLWRGQMGRSWVNVRIIQSWERIGAFRGVKVQDAEG